MLNWRAQLRGALPRLALGAVLGLLGLWLAFREADPQVVWATLRQANYVWVGLAQLSVLGTLLALTARWRLLFYPDHRQRGWLNLLGAILAGQMLNILVPVRLGEVARVYLAGTSEGLSKLRVAATLVVEKVADLALFSLSGLLLVLSMSLPPWLRQSSDTLVITGAVAIAAVLGLSAWGQPLLRRLEARGPRLPGAWGERIWGYGDRALGGLSALRSWQANLALWALSLLVLLLSASTNYLLFLAFGLRLPLPAALFVLVMLQVGTAPPSLPGKLGVFHYLAILALSFFAVDHSVALGYAIALYAVALLSKVVLAGAWLAFARWLPDRARTAASALPAPDGSGAPR